jgi:hypothetical protein
MLLPISPKTPSSHIISTYHRLSSPKKPVLQAFQGLPLQLNMQHGAWQLLHGKAQAMSTAKGLSHREDARSVGRGNFTHGVAKHQGWHLTPPESRVDGKKMRKNQGRTSTLKDLTDSDNLTPQPLKI